MTALSDIEVWSRTAIDQDIENPVISRESLWISDSNSGSYNGQVVFDTNLLSHSSKWLNLNESYIQIPFTFSMKSSIDPGADVPNAYMAGLKCGYYQIVDSISVEYGTKNVVQLQNYLNFHTQFKMLTKSSYDDIRKNGPTLGFIPDSAGSYQFTNAAFAMGDGYSNSDEVALDAEKYLDPELTNSGFLERRAKTTAFSTATAYGNLNTTTTVEQCKRIGKNYFTFNATDTTAASRHYIWYCLCTIKLSSLSDFFEKIPLVKNANMRITVNYNSCVTEIDKVGATQSIRRHTQLSGHTNPLMVGSRTVRTLSSTGLVSTDAAVAGATAAQRTVVSTVEESAGSMARLAVGGDAVITVSCGVGSNSLGASSAGHAITACRLYVPAYKLSPMKELALIKTKPITSFKYNDIYSYTFKVGASQSFNQILTNGIINTKYLLICPFVQGSADGTFTNPNVRIPVWQSIYDSAGGTTSPLVSLNELQVSLAGTNIWNQNQRYDYEAFIDELSKINAVMGNLTVGETSGVLSKFDFDNAYRYYVCDLSRRDSSEDMVPKAINLSGNNNTNLPLDLVCFVAYEREFKVDTISGEPI